MHFSWIQDEWEPYYIQGAKDIILNLIRLHHLSAEFFLMTHRCIGTISRNRQYQKLQQLIPPPNLPWSLRSNRLQCDLRFNIPYMTKNPHIMSSLKKPNSRSIFQVHSHPRR